MSNITKYSGGKTKKSGGFFAGLGKGIKSIPHRVSEHNKKFGGLIARGPKSRIAKNVKQVDIIEGKKVASKTITKGELKGFEKNLKTFTAEKKLPGESSSSKTSKQPVRRLGFAKDVYLTAGKSVAEHRKRVIAKEQYRLDRLNLRASQYATRQLIPQRQGRPIRPLGDAQFGINPNKRLNAGIRRVKGPGPLSDKNFSKKVKQMQDGEV